MITFTVLANLLMKMGAVTDVDAGLLARFKSWQIILGLFCFACAAFCYVFILSWLPLNIAQSFASAQFVAVILASWLILAEPINNIQWGGIVLIALGITVVGWST